MDKYSLPKALYNAVLIDDEKLIREDIAALLKETKVFNKPHDFASVMEAYSFLLKTKKRVDFIFLDIKMKGMKGTQAVALLRSFAHFIIFCTGYTKYALIGHEMLIDGYLVKPITHAHLLPLVNKLGKSLMKSPEKEVSQFIWIKKITKPLPAEHDGDQKGKKTKVKVIKQQADEIRILLDDVVFFRREGNNVQVWGINNQNTTMLLGWARTTIINLRDKYQDTGRFIYINHSELVQEKYIVIASAKIMLVKGEGLMKVTEIGRPYFLEYMNRTNLSKF